MIRGSGQSPGEAAMADSQSGSNVFSLRIVSIDYYMASPIPGYDICYSSFQGKAKSLFILSKAYAFFIPMVDLFGFLEILTMEMKK